MKVQTITLGCKVNQYETEAMLAELLKAGFTAAEEAEEADVVLINSCTVTSQSDHKARQTLHRARREHPSAVIVLTGCMPQAFPEIAQNLTDADIVLGNSNRSALVNDIFHYMNSRQRVIDILPHENGAVFESMKVQEFHGRTRAFLKIEDGCNRFCSYCIIPYARGRVRSKPLDELRSEVEKLAKSGYSEVVLVGINLSAYGQELNLHLCDAVETACSINGIERVRLGSLEPEQLSEDVIARLQKQNKLCPQFHLSLQSGCDETLKRMNRHYTTDEYRRIVRNLRTAFDNASITTDIMVGFPGETEEEFNESVDFLREIGFAKAHVFAYSPRPGTKAAELKEQLTRAEKERRSHIMGNAAQEQRIKFLRSQIGLTEPVLFETEIEKGMFEGYTPNYTPVRALSDENLCGSIRKTKITGVLDDTCTGELTLNK